MNSVKIWVYILSIMLVFQSCGQKPAAQNKEDFTYGTAKFIADESVSPIIDQEEYIFKSIYTDAKPEIIYKPENSAMQLFLNDSIRVAIITRELTKQEITLLNSRKLPPVVNQFAIDAVTLIVNQASSDTLMTVSRLKDMLRNNNKATVNIVVDNPNSSIVNYLQNLSGTKQFNQKNIYSLNSNKQVIKYISQHIGAIGVISYSWLVEPDQDYEADVQKIKVMSVQDDENAALKGRYFKPSQTTLVLKQYPLRRGLYIVNCTGKMGLGTGFASFLASDRGQRIILKSGLLPDSIPQREINIVK